MKRLIFILTCTLALATAGVSAQTVTNNQAKQKAKKVRTVSNTDKAKVQQTRQQVKNSENMTDAQKAALNTDYNTAKTEYQQKRTLANNNKALLNSKVSTAKQARLTKRYNKNAAKYQQDKQVLTTQKNNAKTSIANGNSNSPATNFNAKKQQRIDRRNYRKQNQGVNKQTTTVEKVAETGNQ